jgi:tRNA modification GTPase
MISSLRDTIVAMATPPGESAIGIVRLSGNKTLKIIKECFRPSGTRALSSLKTGFQYRGWIVDKKGKIDDVMIVMRKKPRSYTGEDTVEVYGHGGNLVLGRILALLRKKGARIAEPGEFTRRAFLNGKMSLSQAEAVAWLIQSSSEKEASLALRQMDGDLEERIASVKGGLIHILSTLEATIDFEDFENGIYSDKRLIEMIKACLRKIRSLVSEAENGLAIRRGPKVVIAGKPNVGKSSIFNRLAGKPRAIVSPYPGTTRDTIEETIKIGEIPVTIIDTAGVRKTKRTVEAEGVRRAKEKIHESDLVLAVLDRGVDLDADDIGLLKEIGDKKAIIVINKSDLPSRMKRGRWDSLIKGRKSIAVSARDNAGIFELEEEIGEAIRSELDLGHGTGIWVSARREDMLKGAEALLERSVQGIGKKYSPEFIAMDLKNALDLVLDVRGERYSDEILDEIFSRFCVGK